MLLALLALVGTGVISLCLFRHKIDLKRQETTLSNNVMDDTNKKNDNVKKIVSDQVLMPGASPLSVSQLDDMPPSNSTLPDGDEQNSTLIMSGHHSSENVTAEDPDLRQQTLLVEGDVALRVDAENVTADGIAPIGSVELASSENLGFQQHPLPMEGAEGSHVGPRPPTDAEADDLSDCAIKSRASSKLPDCENNSDASSSSSEGAVVVGSTFFAAKRIQSHKRYSHEGDRSTDECYVCTIS